MSRDDVFERIMLGALIAIGACMVVLVALTAYVIITQPTECRSEAFEVNVYVTMLPKMRDPAL